MAKTSPNASYSSATCGDYYVIQATNVDGFAQPYLVVDPFWAGPTLTQAQCPWTILYYDISIYYNGAWHQRTNNYFTGSWDSTYSTCKLGGQIKVYDPGNDAQKVQVAVKAIYLDGTGEHYAKVGAKVLKTSIIFE